MTAFTTSISIVGLLLLLIAPIFSDSTSARFI